MKLLLVKIGVFFRLSMVVTLSLMVVSNTSNVNAAVSSEVRSTDEDLSKAIIAVDGMSCGGSGGKGTGRGESVSASQVPDTEPVRPAKYAETDTAGSVQ
jgi:hypothetical protein